MSELSREHVDHHLRRERADLEKLRAEFGGEVLEKLDRVTVRDILVERRRAAFEGLFASTEEPESSKPPPTLRVLVSLTTGRWGSRGRTKAPKTLHERRSSARLRRKQGERRASALVKHFDERGGEIEQVLWLTHSVVARVNIEQLADVASRRDVSGVAHTKRVFALALDVSRPLIQADQVEGTLGITGSGVDVAVLDTGVDFSKAALATVAGSQQDFTGEGVGDGHGHGSHCAGVVASNDRTFRGVAPGAVVHDYKLMDSSGSTTSVIAINAITQAVTDGRQVLSNSWGFSHRDGAWVDPDGTCVLCTAADNAMANGSVFLVAAGNEDESTCGTYDTWIRCPGLSRTAITVGASNDSDDMADFSSRGPTPDERCKPDVTAPGVDIVSVRASGTSMGNTVNADWTEASGTSMACPHVAGVAALMLEANSALTTGQVKDVLMSTAVDIGADPCTEQGAGRVDALAAVNAV